MSVSTPTAPARMARAARQPVAALRRAPLPAALLLAALVAATAYATFASGAVSIPNETRLQVALAALAAVTLGGLLFASRRPDHAPALRVAAPRKAWVGLGLLAAFAAWSGLSLEWSIGSDLTWLDLNRQIAYALVAGLALVAGSSLPRAAERAALAFLALATVVALYALGGKLMPWLEVPGVFDLNHTADFSRLRAPLGYWNALGIFCVLALPIGLRTAADFERGRLSRVFAQAALAPLIVTLALTYSRGGLLSAAVAFGVLLALGPHRLRLILLAAVATAGALPALIVGVTRPDLVFDGISVASRTDDGFVMLGALGAGIVFVLLVGAGLRRADRRLVVPARVRRLFTRALAAGAILLALLLIVNVAASDQGIRGTIRAEFDSFTATQAEKQNDPARILRTNSGNRWAWWQEAGGAWSDRPLTGHGAGTFPLIHLGYRVDTLSVREAHSVPLQFLAEVGLIGAVLALGGLALLALAGIGRLRASGARERPYAAALVAAVAAWGTHMWVDWDWDIPAVTLPLLIFLGVLAARPPGAGGTELRPVAPWRDAGGRATALALSAALASAFAISALLPALARDHTSAAFAQAGRGSGEALEEGAREAEIARRLNPLSADPVVAAAAIAEGRGRYADASALLAEGVDRQPNDPQSWLRVATFNVRRDDLSAALAALAEVIRLDPQTEVTPLFFSSIDPGARSATATGTPLPQVVQPPPVPPG